MYFTNFSVTQDGRPIGSFTCKECAVSAAKSRAADTGKPVSVMAHIASGGTKEAVFNPDGTNEKIWNIDKGRPLVPAFGQVYLNRSGGEYRCIDRMPVTGAKVDLRSPGWKERLEGHIGLALLRKRQRQYVLLFGGWSELRESDEALNDFNRSIITHMKMAYGRLYLGSVNYYDGQRERISSGEESVYEEYAGQKIYNFHCVFAVPERDEALEEMIRAWNRGTGPRHAELAEQITKRVDELGGEHFVWY